MAELSVIIPTLNAGEVLGPTLSALAQMESIGLIKDLVVSDGGSEDGTQSAVIDAGANLVKAAPGRGGQLRAGADAARGNWFLFLHADTVLARGWSDKVREFIERSNSFEIAGYFEFALDDTSLSARRLECLVRLRNRLFGLPYGDQGLLLSKRLYQRIGGYQDYPLMEDVDIVRRLGRRALVPISSRATTSAVRFQQDGYWLRAIRNLSCLGLFYFGVPVKTIKKVYG
ncbi:MAG: glycosyl transferase family 2 [Rickettsiales bacterium]|nr:glycosyl transferase family 2 [Rickettsiales bacterium]